MKDRFPQERDGGEIHAAGVHRRSHDGLQQSVRDALLGHLWALHHRRSLRSELVHVQIQQHRQLD